jgi:hypothetical protein
MGPVVEGCDRTGDSIFWLIISLFAAGRLPVAAVYPL